MLAFWFCHPPATRAGRADTRDNSKEIGFRRADDVNGPALHDTVQQTTVSTRILGIVLDQCAALDDLPDFARREHALGPAHLPDGVRQEQQAPRGSGTHAIDDVRPGRHEAGR
jgi:hypothetical protein